MFKLPHFQTLPFPNYLIFKLLPQSQISNFKSFNLNPQTPISNFQISNLKFQTPNLKFQTSNLKFQILPFTNFKFQISNFKSQISNPSIFQSFNLSINSNGMIIPIISKPRHKSIFDGKKGQSNAGFYHCFFGNLISDRFHCSRVYIHDNRNFFV